MSLKLITPPAVEPISLEEARAQCTIDGADSDLLLAAYIQAARMQAEELTGCALITQEWEQRLDAFPAAEVKLVKPPVIAITSINYINASGTEQAIAGGAWVLDADTSPGWLFPAVGATWPSTASVINAVRIRYTAGFGAAGSDVPAPIRAWMLLTIGYLFAQREREDMSGRVAAIPGRFVDSLLDPWRQYGL